MATLSLYFGCLMIVIHMSYKAAFDGLILTFNYFLVLLSLNAQLRNAISLIFSEIWLLTYLLPECLCLPHDRASGQRMWVSSAKWWPLHILVYPSYTTDIDLVVVRSFVEHQTRFLLIKNNCLRAIIGNVGFQYLVESFITFIIKLEKFMQTR